MSDETKAKMSKTRTGRKLSEETKAKISIAHKNRLTYGEPNMGYALN